MSAAGAFASAPTEPIPLRVLYAGNPDSERAKDFVSFLKKHFTQVTAGDYEKFKESDADGHDVIIFDWGQGRLPKAPRLSPSFNRAVVLISAAGERVAEPLKYNIDWL